MRFFAFPCLWSRGVVEAHRSQEPEAKVRTLPAPNRLPFSQEDLETCLDILQTVSEKPEIMDHHYRFKSLITKIHRKAKKSKRQSARKSVALSDRHLIESTEIVRNQLDSSQTKVEFKEKSSELQRAKRCYICKTLFTQLHHFYHQLCPECAKPNWIKRHQRADLAGRRALITGGRIKIGFHSALKLLRDGADVITTTRFPKDAANRYQKEPDFDDWREKLQIFPLDLRNVATIESFADILLSSQPSLDILINNAAQTVKRPLAFYQHLLDTPSDPTANSLIQAQGSNPALLECHPEYSGKLTNVDQYFPKDWYDRDGQQIDLRPLQSWLLKLDDVSTVEMLEVLLVNAAAPFILTSRLKPLLIRSAFPRKFVVNVSAMEGQFARNNKTAFHPHTNMAKAALNMLTRTSASDFANDGIFMNSVDTGWITDEKPLPMAQRVRREHGFYPPLDIIDGAARVYDPIAAGCNNPDEQPAFGKFLKDYQPYPW